jgi:hypothetical protein
MAGVLLRTAGGTLLFVILLWLVRIDDYRVAGMMLTFPMLNGIGLVAAGANAERLTKAMLPVITLNGVMCFLFAWILTASETARSHPALMTMLAVLAWLGVYAALEARNIAFARNATMTAFAAGCALASLAVTYWLWPACASVPTAAVVRPGGLAGVMEGWVTIGLFAASLAIVFGFAHRFQNAHAAIGRLAALPMVPLFGLYTVATVLGPDPAALGKLETMRSMVLIGWAFALLFVVALSRYVMRSAFASSSAFNRLAALIAGWALCLGCIVASAKIADQLAACTGS